jgi:predicted dehydrogenase
MERRTKFSPVKMGVVGLGDFGRLHASTLAGLAESNLVALVTRRQASLQAVADRFPGVPGWTELDLALAESDAEAWVVASSTAAHVSITQRLLAAGKSVLLEKPIAENLWEAESLAPLVQSDSGNLMLGHILLFNSEFRQLKDEVAQRGPIQYIDCVRHRPATLVDTYPDESPFHLTMVHDLYLAQVLMDRVEPAHFSAQSHTAHHTAHHGGACNLALAQLQWSDGKLASFAASFLTPAGMPGDGFDRMEVFGQNWVARIRANPRPIEVWDEKARWPMGLEIRADQEGSSGMLAEQLRCFCRVVRSEQAVPIGATYQDAMQVQRWLEKLEKCVANKD